MENRKKIVVLDGYTLCAGELNFDALREFGEVTVYDRVAQEDVAARGRRAGISAFLQSRWRKSPERRSA